MSGTIATIPRYQFSSATGAPLANGTLTVYVAGSTTPTNTWQDSALTIANTNPVQLDSRGECVLWLDSAVTYKFVLKNAAGVIQWTQDNIRGAANINFSASSGSASVGFIQIGTGAVARTVQDKARESVSVKDFGAVGDGVTDDTTAINVALSAATILKCPVGFPTGTYIVSTTITAPSYFSIVGDDANYGGGDNTPSGEIFGTNIRYTGNVNTPVFVADLASTVTCAIKNMSFRLATTFNNAAIQIKGSHWQTQGGTYGFDIDNINVIREGTIGPQVTNAVGVYLDATNAADAGGVAFFGCKLNRYYAFNVLSGLSISVANNAAGSDNWCNSNVFSNIRMYQVYVGVSLSGGTGANAIWRNTFQNIFIQPGLGTLGSLAGSNFAASGVVADNFFANCIVWDSVADVFLSATHWKQNTRLESFGHFSLDVIAQGVGVFGGGSKVASNGSLQSNGIGAYNSANGQLTLFDSTDQNRQVRMGYDPTLEMGYIQPVKAGVANEHLLLTPSGGNVVVGGTTTDGVSKLQVTGIAKATNLVTTGVAVSTTAGQVNIGGTTGTTVGAAGGASALPATPLGYLIAYVGATPVKIPYYNF